MPGVSGSWLPFPVSRLPIRTMSSSVREKIEDGDIVGHVLRIGRLRQDDEAFLYFEAQDNLAGCLIVFMGQGRDEGMGEKGFIAVA